MGYYLGIIVLALFAVLQNSVLPHFRLLEGQPELVMLAVLAWGWHTDDREAIFWAVVGGIFQDIMNPVIPTGFSIISLGLTVIILKSVDEMLYQFTSQPHPTRHISIEQNRRPRTSILQYIVSLPMSMMVLIGFTFVGTLLNHIALFGLFALQGYSIPFGEYARTFTIPTLGLNLLVILPLYWVLRRIQVRIPKQQRGRETPSL